MTGSDDGAIILWKLLTEENTWEQTFKLDAKFSHVSAIKRLRFREKKSEGNKFTLASAGSDWTVRIFKIKLGNE